MATENKRLNVNPILWSTADKTFVPASGEIWYYYETAGSILSVVGDGSSTVQELRDGAYITQVDNLGLSAGRTAFKELTSGILSTSGWYTIAELPNFSNRSASAKFSLSCSGGGRVGTLDFKVNFSSSTNDKETTSSIEITGKSRFGVPEVTQGIIGARIAKADSVSDAGAKIQVQLDISTNLVVISQMLSNISSATNGIGFELVTPYLDDTPTLPDGVTTATFIEAGAEYSYSPPIESFVPGLDIRVASADSLTCSLSIGEIPKQGSNISITLASSSNFVSNGNNIGASISSSLTISNPKIDGRFLYFQINEPSVFAALFSSTPGGFAKLAISGTGFAVTIT